ncbi:MAG: DUF4198 domain-containing protein [Chitinophagaceae bacterium]|nr:DUF4198 domain-containing protein [Chitinophagaceae bacterium]
MKKIFSSFLLVILFTLLCSHEFWLQPEKFVYDQGECINIRFNAGENFEGENWNGDKDKVQSLDFYFDNWQDTLSPAMLSEKGDSLQLSLMDEGTAMVTFNSKNSFIELDSTKFHDYLAEDGLTNAIEYRKEHNESDSMGREFYQRSVKTILQVGKKYSNTFSQKTKLPLDIIPQSNPYKQKEGDTIAVKIYFKKEVLKNTLVKVWHRAGNKTTKLDLLSDENGEISFEMETTGEWMVSCVKMERLENDDTAQWQSYWGSCTWGYE